MDQDKNPLPDDVDAVVIGATLTGLIAAWELVRTGVSVVVVDAVEDLAETPASIDLVSSTVRDPRGTLAQLFRDLEIEDLAIVYPTPTVAVSRSTGKPLVLDYENVLGIPVSPLDRRVSAVVGAGSSFRGYLDRIKPVLTVGKERFIGPLVRQRLGPGIAQYLVEPVLRDRFGISGDEIEVNAAIPGLNEALTRVGSLSGAVLSVSEEMVAHETLHSLVGGLGLIYSTLLERIAFFGGRFITGYCAENVEESLNPGVVGHEWVINFSGDKSLSASAVIIACEGDNLTIDPRTVSEWPQITEKRTRLRGEYGNRNHAVYSISVMQCDSSALVDTPPYVVAENDSSEICRVERVSVLWPHTVEESPDGYELIRVIRRQKSGLSLQEQTQEIADFMGMSQLDSATLVREFSSSLSLDEARVVLLADDDSDAAREPIPTLSYLPLWPRNTQLDHVVEATRLLSTGIRRTILGIV
ncbi:FAD-dependent monooxygenase [Lysinibacter sp. HNR]|uniref:FAD-dependent monooxygenase n=1 Tax=Lysinibacter sp. HNR TaxID=3031408 RepID=UPI002435B547|nr:FAD-dependent monooxygenase [Lysinibacter sp. HNR]WGD37648.1 FAD-dependent monooxygenase [Lysinibacter sp. HNR]